MLIWRQATTRCNWPVYLGLPADMWQFNGAQGQLVTGFPSLGVMTVRTGTDPSQSNWAPSGGVKPTIEREFYDQVLGAITDTPVKIVHKPGDPSKPDNVQQQRPADAPSGEPGGALNGEVQPALPPAGPSRARAVLLDDAPERVDRAGRVAVRLRCPPVWTTKDGRCRGTVTVKKYGRSADTFDVAPGQAAVVRVPLTPAGLRRLTRATRLIVSLRATTRDDTPAGTPVAGKLEIRRPR
jgi:hypothetical protein